MVFEIPWLSNEIMPYQLPSAAPQKTIRAYAGEVAICPILEAKVRLEVSLPSKLINVTILGPQA